MSTVSTKPVILYAEDDFDDFNSVKEALDQVTDHYVLDHARNGSEAIEYLKNMTSPPDLIVLDLNMPLVDGKEVLVWIKKQEQLNRIPVMIFTTSSRKDDIDLCQKNGCTFFRKPTLYRDLLHVAQTMLQMSATPVR
jgi:CheY-like chemotaxis protein